MVYKKIIKMVNRSLPMNIVHKKDPKNHEFTQSMLSISISRGQTKSSTKPALSSLVTIHISNSATTCIKCCPFDGCHFHPWPVNDNTRTIPTLLYLKNQTLFPEIFIKKQLKRPRQDILIVIKRFGSGITRIHQTSGACKSPPGSFED